MNEEQRLKLEKAKAKARNAGNDPDRGVSVFVNAELDDLYRKLDKLLTVTSDKIDEAGERMADTTKVNLIALNDHLVKVVSLVEQTSKALGEKKVEEVIVKNLPKPVQAITYDDTKQVEELIANRKAIADLKKGLGNIADQIADGLEELKPGQAPTDFVPFRRVYKAGNRLMFDDESWISHGGGAGASSSSSSSGTVVIQDAGGEQATVTGGKLDVNATVSGVGAEYTEGDTDASITGPVMMWEDGSDTVRAVSAAKPLPIGDAGGSLTVDGSVTANAGTNLNTSALALESGGNLAAAAASLSVVDDWDESDRAKVNPIAGQAGVQGGSGTVNALTQRVVLATDVALPAGTNAIGKLAANDGVDIGNVDVASSALPTGAATSAKQPALGTAGSASTDVITIQGIASMTKLLVTPDANSAVNVAQINGVTPLMGAGNTGTGSPRVTIASDQAAIKTTQTPAASGGLSTMMATSADGSTALTSTAQAIKASAGQLFGWYIFNPNSVIAYVNIYNTASGSVTVGTTNPLVMLAIPPSSAANVFGDNGIAFGTAISVAAVMTTAGGTTAPTVALEANFWYA